jgi:thiol-disulfide isomerase/thioredoxin
MLQPDFLRTKFSQALPYDAYTATGTPDQQTRWSATHARVKLANSERSLIKSFTRPFSVLVSSGMWCGDCAQQVPMLDHIAKANPKAIDLRLVDRDKHKDLAEKIMICGGYRVPTVLFLNEEFEFCLLSPDKTLNRLRFLAAKSLGPSCPLPGAEVPTDEAAATMRDWVDAFEHMHLLVRMSPKLRDKHGD